MPMLAHKIRLDPTTDQIRFVKQAAGTARFVWNWALAESNRQCGAGLRPHAQTLSRKPSDRNRDVIRGRYDAKPSLSPDHCRSRLGRNRKHGFFGRT